MVTTMDSIRKADDPICKDKVMSQLFGEFIGFLKSKGLEHGKEFETQIQEIFQCSRRLIWIDEYDADRQITIHFNSIQMFIEFGVVEKKDKNVSYRNKIENLRYKISSCTETELIDSHQLKFNDLFEDFKNKFSELNHAS